MDLGILLTPVSKQISTPFNEHLEDGCIANAADKEHTDPRDSFSNQNQFNERTTQCRPRALFGKSKSFESRTTFKRYPDSVNDTTTPTTGQMNIDTQLIMDVVDALSENTDFVGDGSDTHKLPTISGKHKDLKSISSQTLKRVIAGEYSDVIENYIIVDCRYPYEFEGGHIVGAENLYTREMIVERLLSNVGSTRNAVVIFHCEFSSERGPKLLRHLRSTDRQANAENYPNLHYPEIYLLHGGYKDFFQQQKDLCVPQQYKPMLDKEHSADLRHFRAKSKSWHAGDRRKCLRF